MTTKARIITEEQITIFYGSDVVHFISDGSLAHNTIWKNVIDQLNADDYPGAINTINTGDIVEQIVEVNVLALFDDPESNLFFDVSNQTLMFKYIGDYFPVPDAVVRRMAVVISENIDNQEAVIRFFERLMSNPSRKSIDETFSFLKANNLPLTDDGCFLAWKVVKSDYTDSYTGTIDNSVGSIVTMDRSDVTDNSDISCAAGLHFCSINYLKKSGYGTPKDNPLMIIKVDPADVVSIPASYNDDKGRCCKYQVLGEVNEKTKASLFNFDTNQNNMWEDSVVKTEQVEHSIDDGESIGEVDSEAPVTSRRVAQTFDDMAADAQTIVEDNVYMVIEGEDITESLVNTIIDFIDYVPNATMDQFKQLVSNNGFTPTGRLPSRIFEKLLHTGKITGSIGEGFKKV